MLLGPRVQLYQLWLDTTAPGFSSHFHLGYLTLIGSVRSGRKTSKHALLEKNYRIPRDGGESEEELLVRRTCHHSDSLLSQLKHVPWLLSCAFIKGQQVLKLSLRDLQSTLMTGIPIMTQVQHVLLTHQALSCPNPLAFLEKEGKGRGREAIFAAHEGYSLLQWFSWPNAEVLPVELKENLVPHSLPRLAGPSSEEGCYRGTHLI